MGLIIKNNQMIFSIPNSEAILNVQRISDKQRTVGSYYLSNLADESEAFLNDLVGNFYVDLNASYLCCVNFYNELIENCKKTYNEELFYLKQALDDIKWSSCKNPSSLFFETYPPVIIESRKYLKFPDQRTEMGIFRTLCLGDISEIVIEKLSNDAFRVFVRPKKEARSAVTSLKSLEIYLKSIGRIK